MPLAGHPTASTISLAVTCSRCPSSELSALGAATCGPWALALAHPRLCRRDLALCRIELVAVLDLYLCGTEEAVQRPLLRARLGSLQALKVPIDALLAEGAALDEELCQPLAIRVLELEVHFGGVDRLALLEELSRRLIPEVLRDLLWAKHFKNLLQASVLHQHLDCRRWAHTLECVAVVASRKDAEVYELVHADIKLLQRSLQAHFQNLLLLRFSSHKVPDQNLGSEGQAVGVLRRSCIDLPIAAKCRASCFCLAWRVHHWHAHKPQQLLCLLVLLPGHSDRGLGAFQDLLTVARLHGGLEVGSGFSALLSPRIQLMQLQLRRLPVKDVHRFDPRLHELDGAREHADDVGGDVPIFVGQIVVRT
mmetsp:Transcript_4305/g.12551  ORF Transcript_4305/g.12551 Transcript_4305/m.12551 type:complete len:365 (+) Transcript_4305:153-1247(+)